MLYKTGRADGSPTFGGNYAEKTMEILVCLQQRWNNLSKLEAKEVQDR
tara:strand:- start:355 stop:498 length:144 start_codon:yes stop_codon:yes gene_type:complete